MAKRIRAHGVEYDSVDSAAKGLGISKRALRAKLEENKDVVLIADTRRAKYVTVLYKEYVKQLKAQKGLI